MGYSNDPRQAVHGTRRGGGGGGGQSSGRAGAKLNPDAADESGQIGLKPASPGEQAASEKPTHELQTRVGGDSSDGPKFRVAKVGNNTPGPMGRNTNFDYGQDEGTASGMGSSATLNDEA